MTKDLESSGPVVRTSAIRRGRPLTKRCRTQPVGVPRRCGILQLRRSDRVRFGPLLSGERLRRKGGACDRGSVAGDRNPAAAGSSHARARRENASLQRRRLQRTRRRCGAVRRSIIIEEVRRGTRRTTASTGETRATAPTKTHNGCYR